MPDRQIVPPAELRAYCHGELRVWRRVARGWYACGHCGDRVGWFVW